MLQQTDYEVHRILSDAGKINLVQETQMAPSEAITLAMESHDNRDIGASLASGSFTTNGMLVAPCSMKTLSNIAHGNSGTLITRAADVTLKERRPLVLMPREKPFNRIHLKNMLEVTDAGGIIMPPFPSFYQNYDNLDEMISRTMARTLRLLEIDIALDEWEGLAPPTGKK